MFYVYWIYFWDNENIYSSGYVGITDNLKNRFSKHKKRFGNFKFKIIFTGNKEQAFALEYHLRPNANIGLNKAIGGLQFGIYSPMTGRSHSTETIEKIRQSNLGKKRSEETIINMKAAKQNISIETRAKTAASSKGRKHTNETKIKVSKALAGHIVSEETRAKISMANKGRKHSKEDKRKMSEGKWNRLNIVIDPNKVIILN